MREGDNNVQKAPAIFKARAGCALQRRGGLVVGVVVAAAESVGPLDEEWSAPRVPEEG